MAISIGFPLVVVGVLLVVLLLVSHIGVATSLWILGGGLLIAGLLAALSGRIL